MRDASLNWLVPLDERINRQMIPYRPSAIKRAATATALSSLVQIAHQLKLTLPSAFMRLLDSAELQDRIPSVAACTFELKNAVPCPERPDYTVIRFLNDQQSVLTWYLLAKPEREPQVVVSNWYLDATEADFSSHEEDRRYEESAYHDAVRMARICAFSFEDFLHRAPRIVPVQHQIKSELFPIAGDLTPIWRRCYT